MPSFFLQFSTKKIACFCTIVHLFTCSIFVEAFACLLAALYKKLDLDVKCHLNEERRNKESGHIQHVLHWKLEFLASNISFSKITKAKV